MIKFSKKNHYPDVDLYDERINGYGQIFFDKERALRILKYNKATETSSRRQAERVLKVNSSNRYKALNDENILNYLEIIEGCPSYKFDSKKNVKGYTLEMTKVLKPLFSDGYAQEFLEPYINYKSMKAICSRIESLTKSLLDPVGVSNDGTKVYSISFTANPQFNLRFNYRDYDIITIPKAYNSCICAPEGYYMVWGDFSQSDLRIAYNVLLRDENNAKVMDDMMEKYNDMYAGMAKLVADGNGTEFDYEKFKEDRPKFKVNVLAPIYGQIQGKTEEDAKFVKEMVKFLETCPRYQEYRRRLEDWMDLNLPLVATSYFGHEEIIPKGYDRNASINTALNSPIQTGTSEIVISVTNSILEKFYDLGYTPEDVRLYYTRHDEPIFLIKQSALKDAWIFKECSKIIVDNWTPLELEFHYGFRYKEPAESLEKRIQNIYELNSDKITIVEPDPSNTYEYMPVPKVLKLYVGTIKIGDKQTIISIYNAVKEIVKYISVNSVDNNTIVEALRRQLLTFTEKLNEGSEEVSENYHSILVYTDLCDFEDFENGVYIKGKYVGNVSQENKVNVGKANMLSLFCADAKYPNNEDVVKMASLFKTNKQWMSRIEGVQYAKFYGGGSDEELQE